MRAQGETGTSVLQAPLAPLPSLEGIVRGQTRPVSWLEEPSQAFPGLCPQWQVVRRRSDAFVRSSYSGGAAPVSHRTSGRPRLPWINCG
jgi:hypothetical protein